MAQRLVRRVCRDCAMVVSATEREKEIFQENGMKAETVTRGRGCAACSNTGYRGRIAIHEILPVDRGLKELIIQQASGTVLRDYMKQKGHCTLLQDGLRKVLEGMTTSEEVLRVATTE
jgi:type IV pilus assembly protein PilB